MTHNDAIYSLAVAGVQRLVPYVAGKPIEELERELGLTEIIKLASNENPLGPGKMAQEAIQATLPTLSLYPDSNGFNLKTALAKKYRLNTDQITLGNGSNELLELVARGFLGPNLEALFSEHAFAIYPIATQAVGATAVVVPALNYGNDLGAMAAMISHKTRVVFIANPNNPTGTLLSQRSLERFIAALPAHCLCLLDEAYFEFVEHQEGIDSVTWLQTYPNLIITRTFSKAYGLAGLRVGYCLSSPEVADILNRVRQPFNNNALALAAAEAALSDSDHLQRTLTVNAQGMRDLIAGFSDLGLEWIPSAGNFISVDVKQSGQVVYDALLRKGVIVRPIANYGLPHHLRISIGTEAQNQFFLQALNDTLNNV